MKSTEGCGCSYSVVQANQEQESSAVFVSHRLQLLATDSNTMWGSGCHPSSKHSYTGHVVTDQDIILVPTDTILLDRTCVSVSPSLSDGERTQKAHDIKLLAHGPDDGDTDQEIALRCFK
jgi:hypothetical protein